MVWYGMVSLARNFYVVRCRKVGQGLVGLGVVRRGLAWSGVAWSGRVWLGKVWFGVVWFLWREIFMRCGGVG